MKVQLLSNFFNYSFSPTTDKIMTKEKRRNFYHYYYNHPAFVQRFWLVMDVAVIFGEQQILSIDLYDNEKKSGFSVQRQIRMIKI